MRTLEMKKAKASIAEYARGLKKGPVIFTDKGKPVAALLSLENADLETATLSTNPKFIALIERSRLRQRTMGGLSPDEMRDRLHSRKRKPRVS